MDLGDEVVNEYKIELLCEDGEVDELSTALVAAARTGQAVAGWVTVCRSLPGGADPLIAPHCFPLNR